MKKYAIIDIFKIGEGFEEHFDTKKEALKEANAQWNHLTEHDKKKRDVFVVMYGEIGEDECLDMNTAEIIKDFIQEGSDQ